MAGIIRKLPLFLSSKEVERLLKSVTRDRHRLGLALMCWSGLRVSEMRTLRVEDINLARGFLRVKGKGNKERIVPLTARVQTLIEDYLRMHSDTLAPDSLLIGGSRSAWHRLCRGHADRSLARRDVHCHTLRHSFATNLYEEGIQIERISQLLGHARLDTTMIYAHISVEQKREAVTVLDSPAYRIVRKLTTINRTIMELSVTPWHDREVEDQLIGRAADLKAVNGYLSKDVSVLIYGEKGVGKSALLRSLSEARETSSPGPFSSEEKGSTDEDHFMKPSPPGRGRAAARVRF